MSDWTLIYSTDSGGAPVFGSLSALKVAVLAAADVKVMYSPRSGIWWSRYCASVSTRGSGSSSLVSATYMEAADTKVGATGLEFATPFALEYQIYNSNGVQQLQKSGVSSSNVVPMRWYVKDFQPAWQSVATTIAKKLEP